MYPWAPETSASTSTESMSGAGEKSPPPSSDANSNRAVHLPLWVRVLPFVASALLFMSAFFAIFAPFPLLIARLRSGTKWFLVALLTNSLVVALASGWTSFGAFLILGGVVAATMGAGFERGWRVERVALFGVLGIFSAGFAWLVAYSAFSHVGVFEQLRHQFTLVVDIMVQAVAAGPEGLRTGILAGAEISEWREALVSELPGAIAVFALMTVVLNMIIAIRLNPAGVREKCGLGPQFLLHWRAPEVLVWPTIFAGFLLLFDLGPAAWAASALFKSLMAVYALQGLSILAFFLELWRIRGGFRTVALVIAIFLMTPLLLSLGFFDLWFDFRSKFRQS